MQRNAVQAVEKVERAVEAAKSKQPRLKNQAKFEPSAFFASTFSWVTQARDQEPDYKPDSRVRDKWLSMFWRREPHLAGVISSVNSIDANRGWHLIGGRNQVNRYTDILRNAEDGAGWRQYISLQSSAYYTADIGALTETGRDGREGPLRALYHLDPTKCNLTGNRKLPLQYHKTKDSWSNDDYFRLVSMRNIMEEYNGLGYCLHRDSSVLMWDGRYRRIIDLVTERSQELVASVNSQGQIVPKPITNWYTNVRAGRELVNLRARHAKNGQGNRERNTWLTEDHPVLTPEGYVPAGELQTGDKIITNYPAPNECHRELMIGMLLGDASLSIGGKTPRMNLGHKRDAAEWFYLKTKTLSEFGWNSYWDKEGYLLRGDTRNNPAFTDLHEEFYRGGKKSIPVSLVRQHLSPLLLAVWYLDDGHISHREINQRNRQPYATISSSGSKQEDVEEMCRILTEFGYTANPVSARGVPGDKNISFTVEGSKKLFRDIAPYVPECMRYKLPYDSMPYDPRRWELGLAERFVDEVEVHRDNPKSCQTVYCIDVEDTHNFVTGSVVVHNCAESRVLDLSKIMLAVYSHELEMLGARAPKGLLLLQNISEDQWKEAMKSRDAALDSDMRKYYNAVAVLAQQGVDSVDAKLVALSQLPQGFDLEVFTNLLMYAYALCFGYDPIEFWPVLAGQLGRGRETDIQHRKGTGKGGLNFMLAFQEQLQMQLPETLHFEFEQRDQEGVLLDAQVGQAYADLVTTLYGGKATRVPGPGGEEGGNTMPTVDDSGGVISREEARSMLATAGVIPATWTNMEEDVTSTDARDVEQQQKREQLMENETVRRAIYQFPNEPIVRYSWPKGRTEILFASGHEATQRTRYTLVKPIALIPDFSENVVDAELVQELEEWMELTENEAVILDGVEIEE